MHLRERKESWWLSIFSTGEAWRLEVDQLPSCCIHLVPWYLVSQSPCLPLSTCKKYPPPLLVACLLGSTPAAIVCLLPLPRNPQIATTSNHNHPPYPQKSADASASNQIFAATQLASALIPSLCCPNSIWYVALLLRFFSFPPWLLSAALKLSPPVPSNSLHCHQNWPPQSFMVTFHCNCILLSLLHLPSPVITAQSALPCSCAYASNLLPLTTKTSCQNHPLLSVNSTASPMFPTLQQLSHGTRIALGSQE